MTKHNGFEAVSLSRRAFLVTTGGFSIAVAFGGAKTALAQGAKGLTPNAWATSSAWSFKPRAVALAARS